jgi:hypothetical protein
MTPQEWIARLKAVAADGEGFKRVLFFATKATMAQVAAKGVGEGTAYQRVEAGLQGRYDLYAYKPPSPVKPTGKGKTGKNIKGGYYPNYEAYKAQQGRADLPFRADRRHAQGMAGRRSWVSPQRKGR